MGELSLDFRRHCDAIATRQRSELGLAAFDPLPARQLARKMAVSVFRPQEIAEISAEVTTYMEQVAHWRGVVVCFDPRTVLYNPQLSPAGFESTIMHELAHFLLDHPPTRLYMLDDERYYREYNTQIEREAAYLGSCLQIPRGGVVWARQGKMNKQEIAAHFGASEKMVQWRLNAVKF